MLNVMWLTNKCDKITIKWNHVISRETISKKTWVL